MAVCEQIRPLWQSSANVYKFIMEEHNWDAIDISWGRGGCSAELEDNIEGMLREVQAEQGIHGHDVSSEDAEFQKELAATVKRLCLRQKEVEEARTYFGSKQKDLCRQPTDEHAPSVYFHQANNLQNRKASSISPKRKIFESIEEKQEPERRVLRSWKRSIADCLLKDIQSTRRRAEP